MVRELFNVTPDPWQEEALVNFPKQQRMALLACKGPGKAQPKQLHLPTPDGARVRFGDLKVGDKVFAGDGSVTTIKAIYDRGILPVYRVEFDDGSATLCCGEHLWKVRGRTERRHDTWSVLTTEQIIARGVREKNGKWAGRHFEIPRQGAARFPGKELPLDPYLMGVWLGDGVRLKPSYATKPTPEIAEEIARRGYDVKAPKRGLVTILGLTVRLRKAGVLALHSCDRFVPAIFKTANVADREDLIRGLMDTDGGIGADGHMEFGSTSLKLAEDLVWLVRSVGGVAFIKAKVKQPYYRNPSGEIVKGKPCYRVTVCTPFNPFLVPHRRERWKEPTRSPSTIRYLTRKIDQILPSGTMDCMCIEVEHPSSLYLTNDFIVTHNTALESWLAWNFLLTRPFPKMAATSISGQNLQDNLWSEMAKWRNAKGAGIIRETFEWTKQRIYNRQAEETWFMSARTWPRDADPSKQADTLAGLHADYIFFILDESGGIPDAVMATAEAALSSCIEGHILQGGNPTTLAGPLYRAATSARRLWYVISITGDPDDPKRSPRISVDWAKEQIEQFGRDSPWVLVNVFGRFPPSSLNVLIGPDEVEAAQKRFYREWDYRDMPRVMGVDVAAMGDDASVIFCRQGLQSFPMIKKRNISSLQGAGLVARKWDDWGADACFVDATGGFGAGWVDQLIQLGKAPVGVHFSAKAHQDSRYYNKRTEMYFDLVEWIKRGGALPPSPEILAALTQTTYSFKGDRLLLEPKEMVKAKLGYSPDETDAAALTFAEPVTAQRSPAAPKFTSQYDPMREANAGFNLASAVSDSYDPFNH